jgi:hypothetical protein
MSSPNPVPGKDNGNKDVNGGKKRHRRINKMIKLNSGTVIAFSEFEEVKRHREVRDA